MNILAILVREHSIRLAEPIYSLVIYILVTMQVHRAHIILAAQGSCLQSGRILVTQARELSHKLAVRILLLLSVLVIMPDLLVLIT